MLTTMGIVARTLNLDIAGATAVVEKEMTSSPPRRIQRLTVRIHIPHALSEEDRVKLEGAAHGCPVCRSLHAEVEKVVEFVWG
jgi:putative redox protein